MATPNYKSPTGALVTNRYDFQNHITGTSFRHTSDQIDVTPAIDINGIFYHNVADALTALSSLTSVSNILIFKPHGVANSNVYTSWTALFAARNNIQGPATIVVDSLANTTIASGSNGATLPQSTINVISTTGFAVSGTLFVISNSGLQTVTYSGTTSTSFIGCSGGSGTLATGGFVYQNVGATIDLGTWDLNGNTSIVGNLFSVSLFVSYNSTLFIPDGARLINPVLFSNMSIFISTNNPLGAIDISPPFSLYTVEFDRVLVLNSGSGPSMNAQNGNININNRTIFISGTVIGGSLSGTLTIDLNDGSEIGANSINVSSGTVDIHVNGAGAQVFTPQTGTVNIIGLVGDINGQINSNIITNISGDGINPVNINANTLQWSASPTGGSPVTLNQAQSLSGLGDTLLIEAQAAATGSNTDGGALELISGVGDGSGASGSLLLATGDGNNGIFINASNNSVTFSADSASVLRLGSSAGGIALGASSTISLSAGGTITLTTAEYKFPYLIFNGTLPNNTTIILPTSIGSKWVVDATAVTLSGHTITLRANSINWGTTIGTANLYEVVYGGTGKIYGVALT